MCEGCARAETVVHKVLAAEYQPNRRLVEFGNDSQGVCQSWESGLEGLAQNINEIGCC